jgi:hypothetical protein
MRWNQILLQPFCCSCNSTLALNLIVNWLYNICITGQTSVLLKWLLKITWLSLFCSKFNNIALNHNSGDCMRSKNGILWVMLFNFKMAHVLFFSLNESKYKCNLWKTAGKATFRFWIERVRNCLLPWKYFTSTTVRA